MGGTGGLQRILIHFVGVFGEFFFQKRATRGRYAPPLRGMRPDLLLSLTQSYSVLPELLVEF